jgi:hypothetical protein
MIEMYRISCKNTQKGRGLTCIDLTEKWPKSANIASAPKVIKDSELSVQLIFFMSSSNE